MNRLALFALPVAVLMSLTVGCESSSMDKDLKRSADRATITLDRTKAELQATKAENDRLKKDLATLQKSASLCSASSQDLQAQLAAKDAELRKSLIRIRELEQAAVAARQGMPATRTVTP